MEKQENVDQSRKVLETIPEVHPAIGFGARCLMWIRRLFTSIFDSISGSNANCVTTPVGGMINGHDYVDLGLSVKWATCNIGASSPYDNGDYFAWGEVSPKSEYTEDNCVTYGKTMGNISGDPQHDAARSNWGGSWRLPTEKELEELRTQCRWTWTVMDGTVGYRVTGKNGYSIFLPAAGYWDGTSPDYVGEYGDYWSATSDGDNADCAYGLGFGSLYYNVCYDFYFYGCSVRPVSG